MAGKIFKDYRIPSIGVNQPDHLASTDALKKRKGHESNDPWPS